MREASCAQHSTDSCHPEVMTWKLIILLSTVEQVEFTWPNSLEHQEETEFILENAETGQAWITFVMPPYIMQLCS